MAKVTTFTAETAKAIARYVKEKRGQSNIPSNDINSRTNTAKECFGRITGSILTGGIYYHSWVEVRFNQTDRAFEETPDGRSGELDVASAVNGPDLTTALDNDTVVRLVKMSDPETGEDIWISIGAAGSGSIEAGAYQHMVYSTTASNSVGWDFPRLHEVF